MEKSELYRWVGSIGVFYVAGSIWIIFSGHLYKMLFPFIPNIRLTPTWLIIGLVAFVIGTMLILLSYRLLLKKGKGHPFDFDGKEKLSRPTQKLLTEGVYYYTQNPMGLGDLLLYSSIAVFSKSLSSLIINIPAFYFMVWFNNRFREKPSLMNRFGYEYVDYEKNTSVIIPGWRTIKKIWRDMREQ